jgi:hypothetical protein
VLRRGGRWRLAGTSRDDWGLAEGRGAAFPRHAGHDQETECFTFLLQTLP